RVEPETPRSMNTRMAASTMSARVARASALVFRAMIVGRKKNYYGEASCGASLLLRLFTYVRVCIIIRVLYTVQLRGFRLCHPVDQPHGGPVNYAAGPRKAVPPSGEIIA